MKASFLKHVTLEEYGLASTDLFEVGERTLILVKWNWRYDQALEFQRQSVRVLQELPQLRVLVCCSHPRVFTYGRGLQKPRKGETLLLQDFDPANGNNLPYPFYRIERGGGLTFHHPGQFVFYPILKLNPKVLTLSKLIDDVFDFSAETLAAWGIPELDHKRSLLGLWHGERKLASMGIAIERLTTFHGMALNIKKDEAMAAALRSVNPCGLGADTYVAAEDLVNLPEKPLGTFCDQFLNRISHGWQ